MRLARVANSLTLAYAPLFIPISDQRPGARRARFAELLHSAALLKEGLHTCRSLAKWFRDKVQYSEGIESLLRDPHIQQFETEIAHKIRNEIAFRFDREAMAVGMARLPDQEMIVASYPPEGPAIGETYFDVADDAILGYLFGDAQTGTEYLHRLEAFMTRNAELLTRFLQASHRLVAIGLVDLGCRK